MNRRVFVFFCLLPSILLLTGLSAEAQQVTKESRIGVLGAPEEPRFSEIVAGLKQGLGELGYASQALQIVEAKVARKDEGAVKSIVEGLLRQRAQVLFLIGSRLLKPARAASAEMPIVFITPGDPVSGTTAGTRMRRLISKARVMSFRRSASSRGFNRYS